MQEKRTQLHEILERSNFSPTTKRKYESVLDMWIAFAGDQPSDWTRKKAQAFYIEIRKRVKPTTANVYLASLRYVSKWYARFEQNDQLDFAVVQLEGLNTSLDYTQVGRRALTQAEVESLLGTCRSKPVSPIDRRDRTMIVVALETGMRRKSLVGMDIENIGKTRDFPSVKVPIKGKGGIQTYAVPLSETVMHILSDWREWLSRRGIKSGSVFRRLDARVSKHGKRDYEIGTGVSAAAINKIISERAERAGIQHVHPHLLRHTFLTWRRDAGLEHDAIASITGHRFKESFMDVYVDKSSLASSWNTRNTTPKWLVELVDRMIFDDR